MVALAYGSFGAADLTVDVAQQPEHGTVELTASALGRGTYTPSAGWVGSETFTYTVSDGTTTTDPLTAWVTALGPDTHTWDGGAGTDKWSDAANWVGDTVPESGDSLVFPDGTLYDPVNDFEGLTLHDVTLARPGMSVLGKAIVLTGALVRTVAGEAEIDWHPDLQLGDEATLGSTAGIVAIKAAVTGGDLVKTGAGTVSLRHATSYTGKTVVEGGTLHFNADGALPAGSAVSIADGATVDVDPYAKGTAVYDNVFSGPEGAKLRLSYGLPELTADSSGFAGTTEAETSVIVTGSLGGTISGKNAVSGSGTVGAMDGVMVLPSMRGEESFAISTLTGSCWTGPAAGFGVTDAAGDPGLGFDQLRITGDVDIPAVIDGKGGLMVVPMSIDGTGASGLCANFDPTRSYRWPVVRVDGQVNGFDPAAVSVFADAFLNDLAGGAFGLEVTDHTTYRTLDLVFTPSADAHVWDGEAGTEHPEWSNALNWVGDVLPAEGDALMFPAGSGYVAANDDFLTVVGAVSVGRDMFVDGSALGLGADLTLGRDSVWAVSTTTLEKDVRVLSTETPDPTPSATPYAHLGQDIEMLSPTSGAHALTVENSFGSIVHHGSLTGADAACGLTKKGEGTFVLGGPGGKGSPWTGVNSWAGPTDVQAGMLSIEAPGALSSHTEVHMDGVGTVTASFPDPTTTDVWSNTFTGSGRVEIESAALTMTAASAAFVGTVDVHSGSSLTTTGSWPADTLVGGLLRGTGAVGYLDTGSGGTVSPGVDDYESSTLAGGGMARFRGGSGYVCDVTDADEAAGLGHDLLALKGDVTFSDTTSDAVTVFLRSGAGGAEGPAPGFEQAKPYRWTVLTTPTQINGFGADTVKLDTTAFEAQNPVGEGTFALDVADHTTYRTLDVVYTPSEDTHVWDGGGTDAKWSTAANWVGDVAPRDGDTLVFSGSVRTVNTNDLLTSVGGIELTDGGFVLGGTGLTLTGPVTSSATGTQCIVNLPVTLGADLSATTESADLSLLFVHLNDGLAGHALTAGGAGTVYLGSIDGAGVASTLTKTGAGKLYLVSENTFGGAVAVSEGTLATVDNGALPSGNAVSVASGATLESAPVDGLQMWDNPVSGPSGAAIQVAEQRDLKLTGDCSGFTGTATVNFKSGLIVDDELGGTVTGSEGVVAGGGTLGALSGPTIWPGLRRTSPFSAGVAAMTAGAVSLPGDRGVVVDMHDAAGVAGVGFDHLEVTGAVEVTATAATPFAVMPVTITAAGEPGDCSNFDRTTDQSWPVLHAADGITGFAADKCVVITDGFSNATGGGAFSVALSDDAKTLSLVFTAGHPLSVWDGGAGTSHPEWSNALNWVGDVAPVENADLSFPSTPVTAHNDAFLTRVHNVTIGAAAGIDGSALTLGGDLTLTTHSSYGISATTLAADTTVLYAAAGYTNPATIAGDIQMVDGSSIGHALTFDVRNGGSILTTGRILGTKAACTLTMTGNGVLELGNGAGWSGDNTWSGDTNVQSGWITVRRPGALSSLSGSVHIGADAGVDYDLNAATPHAISAATWAGSGYLRALNATDLQLTADSSGFTGTLDGMFGGQIGVLDRAGGNAWTHNGGGFYGHGTLGSLNMGWQGALSPGDAAYKIAQLSGTGDAVLGWGTYTVDVKDATGEAGVGYDTFTASGSHGIYVNDHADEGRMLTIALRSSDGSAAAKAADFDPTKTCRWHIASATNGAINWFDRAVYTIDTTAFTNDLDGGSFALGLSNDGKALDVVFTPCADFTKDPVVGDGGDSFAKGSEQTVAWEMGAAPPSGSVFKVVADDPDSATNVLLATVPATGETKYDYDWTIGQGPSAGWHVTVQLWSGAGDEAVQYRTRDSQDFDILAASYTITVTAGDHGEITPATGSVTTYADKTYTITPDTGYHVDRRRGRRRVPGRRHVLRVPGRARGPRHQRHVRDRHLRDRAQRGRWSLGPRDDRPGRRTDRGLRRHTNVHFYPNEGYRVEEVKVDDVAVSPTPTDEYTFAAVSKGHTISVEFAVDTFEITVTAGAHGKIEPGTGPVEYGSSPKYVVTADEGYHIADVVADGTSLGAVPDVTFSNVAKAHTLSATFAIDTFTITPSVVGGASGHGTISPATPQTAGWHTTPTFTFAPHQGYAVDVVRVDDTPVAMTAPDAYTFPAVTAGHTISVSFKPLTFVISVSAGEHGSVTPGSGSVGWGSTPEYSITPDEGYRVADVLVDGTSVGAVSTYRFAAVTAAHTLAAGFVAEGMPWATVSGASGSWSKRPVTLTFTGHPGEGGVPVAFTEYRLGDGDWTQGGSVTVGAQGATEVWYRAVDEAGTVQDPVGRCLVRVDSRRPRVTAKPLSARPSTIARLRYNVKDPLPSSGLALLRCVVRDSRGRVMTRSSSVPVKVNRWLKLRVSTWAIHEAGRYTVELRAKDLAGNWQRGWTRVRLTVR